MNRSAFYKQVRAKFGALKQSQVDGFELILDEATKRGVTLPFLAYILATVWWETAHTMQPIAEYGNGRGRKYGIKGKHGQVAYGRGYVQLTWDYNYENADKKLGLGGALTKDYELAMDPKIAVLILFEGMEEGWFTGKDLDDFIDQIDEDNKEDLREFANARRIINGTDKQVEIGKIALTFEVALRGSDYGAPLPAPQPSPQASPKEQVCVSVTEAEKSVLTRVLNILLKALA
ncbi:lysozyme family protein [Sinorhizobium meliloti]|uniref:hypothetical protein n=1 Tax=Rhizobium meliloti TaxID=382 RepID=UPI0019120548|nr:hypothetical protein [Sinorhizobium meliloti]